MAEIEIGRGKRARVGYSFDDISIVPSRRTRDANDVSVSWQLDANLLDIPVLSAPMDSVTSPQTAIALGKLGGVGVLDLEGLWTRYEDPQPHFDAIANAEPGYVTKLMQRIYKEPVKPELIAARLAEIRSAGVVVAGALFRSVRRSIGVRLWMQAWICLLFVARWFLPSTCRLIANR